jgi:hypothetical protein
VSDVLVLADARARGLALPSDNGVAQGILDEEEDWLARRIGPLTGLRTETFYVGYGAVHGKLALRRYTDEVTVTDGQTVVDTDHYRLVDNGAAFERTYLAAGSWWNGPYVSAAYEPNDITEVRKGLYALVGIALEGIDNPGQYQSETLGDYGYTRGTASGSTPAARRAGLVAGLLPKRDPLTTLYSVSRSVRPGDPVINRPEWP